MLNAGENNSVFIPKLSFKIITDFEELHSLAGEWDALLARARGDGLHFQSFAWCNKWWQHYREDTNSLYVVVGYAIDRVVLIWPLVLNTKLSGRTLEWTGMPLSQYGDIVVEDHDAARHWSGQAWEFLTDRSKVDLIELDRVRESSVINSVLSELGVTPQSVQEGPSLDLTQFGDFEAYRKSLSKNNRKHRNRMRRQLSEQNPLSFEVHTGGDKAIAAIKTAMAYKADWLRSKGLMSRAFGDTRKEEFWMDLAGETTPTGLAVSELRCGDVPIAIEIGLRYGGRHVSHVGAFNLDFGVFSPGTVQMEDTIADCFANGIHVYDMLPPNDEYKERWANQSETVSDYTVVLGKRGHVLKQLGALNVNAMLKSGFYSLPASVRKSMVTLVQGAAGKK